MSNSDPTDTAITAAFEELRREVSLTRAAVEGLPAARERIPDYTETLVQIVERLEATVAATARIEKHPRSVSPPTRWLPKSSRPASSSGRRTRV